MTNVPSKFYTGNREAHYIITIVIIIIIKILILFTAIVLLPCGSGYFSCKQFMKLDTTEFTLGGLHEKH